MKILFLFTYNKSFLSNIFLEFAKSVKTEKNEVVVFSLKKKANHQNVDGVTVISKKANRIFKYFLVVKFILQYKPDIIISNFSYTNPSILSKLFINTRVVVWMHTLEKQINSAKWKVLHKKLYLKKADKFIVNSPGLESELKHIYKIQSEIKKIPFWTEIEKIDIRPEVLNERERGVKMIGVPGRLHISKNQLVVLQALAKVKSDVSNRHDWAKFICYFAGKGEEYSSLKDTVIQLGLEEEVVFLGTLSREEMKSFYLNCDLIILPSLYEAFGLVLIEAMALGVPLIVSNKFGALSFIEKKNELLTFDPDNINSLKECLDEIIKMDLFAYSEKIKEIYNASFKKEVIISNFKKFIL